MPATAAAHTHADLQSMSKDQLIGLLLQQQRPLDSTGSTAAAAAKRPAAAAAGATGDGGPAAKRPKERDTSGRSRKEARKAGGGGGPHKAFQMERFASRHIALKVCYFGHSLHGFAAQDGREDTVEHLLFDALLRTRLVTDR